MKGDIVNLNDAEFLGQLVDSMSEAVEKLEKAISEKDTEKANKLRVFIFDLHRKIDFAIGGKNA